MPTPLVRTSFPESNFYVIETHRFDGPVDDFISLLYEVKREIDAYYEKRMTRIAWDGYFIDGLLDSNTFTNLRGKFKVDRRGRFGFKSADRNNFAVIVQGCLFRFSRIKRYDGKMAILFPGLPVLIRYNN